MGFINKFNPKTHKQVYSFFTPEECTRISKILLRDEPMVLDIPNNEPSEYYTGTTNQFNVYNWLDNPDIIQFDIPKRLFTLPEFRQEKVLYVQCWANILRQGQKIPDHTHANDYHTEEEQFYASNTFISGPTTTGTHYNDAYERNEIGQMNLLGSQVTHGVRTHMSHTPRISMAMDIYCEKHPIIENAIRSSDTNFISSMSVSDRIKRVQNRYLL